MKITSNSLNFNGFRNVIAGYSEENPNMTFIAAQLTNEGDNDLSTFKLINSRVNVPKEELNNDIFVVSRIVDIFGEEYFSFCGKPLYSGPQLLDIEDNIPESMSQKMFNKIYNEHLWIYTFLAKATKHMVNSNCGYNDNRIRDTIEKSLNVLEVFCINKKDALLCLDYFINSKISCQKVASTLNNQITDTMKKFFK